jgi:hypothetical protein
MKLIVASTVALAAAPAMGFVIPASTKDCSPLSMSSAGLSDDYSSSPLPTQKGKKMSESIPFLKCPPLLGESDLAGNFGFDPLGLAKNKEQLWDYREAEVKHARLAMLVSAASKKRLALPRFYIHCSLTNV